MTARLRSGGGAEPELVKSLSSEEEGFFTGGPSINNKAGGLSDEDHTPLLPRLQVTLPVYVAILIATFRVIIESCMCIILNL